MASFNQNFSFDISPLNRKFELYFLIFNILDLNWNDYGRSSVKTRGFFFLFEFRIERKTFLKRDIEKGSNDEREYTKAYVGKAFSGQVSAIRSPSLYLSLSRLIVREGEKDIGPVING